jgi:hypothetical protein
MENSLYKKVDDNPLKNGINIDLVTPESVTMSDSFVCVICLNLVLNPVFCEESECVFCKMCIESWNKKEKNCPNCRKEFKPNTKISRIVKNMLYKVKIRCFYLSEGCNMIIEYEKYEAHLDECDFGQYTCLIPGCSFVSKKKEMLMHVENCSFLQVICEFCSKKVQKNTLKNHYLICGKYNRFCPVCKGNFENIEMSIHNNGECFETLTKLYLSNCQANDLSNKELIKDYEETKSDNSILVQKLKLLELDNKNVKADNEKKEKRINELIEENNKLKLPIIQNNNNDHIRNTVSYGPQGVNHTLCQNNLHDFTFLRRGIMDVCYKCKKEINCRFQCKKCKSNFCYKCNLPSEKMKCPTGHSLIKLKRNLPFCCDLCMEYYDENSTSYCDKECDIDICEKCYKSKECLVF